jgi:hypothetical protein
MKKFWKRKEEPFECAYCSRYFVSKRYVIMTLSAGEQFGICENCRRDVLCDVCGAHIKPHEVFLEECPICEKITLACRRCSHASLPLWPRLKDRIGRWLYRTGLFGLNLVSSVTRCCVRPGETPLRVSAVFYLKKSAKENTDKEKNL